jgi:hypothetical protein
MAFGAPAWADAAADIRALENRFVGAFKGERSLSTRLIMKVYAPTRR